ncbi:GNAT family N-acetyltransferase [Carnobacteriaceae bacterium zg-ZUI252]|nr:GNAT family N-acetyltransferase [Carnobacteriaceae bacterium zg-ZUI252]
MICYKSFSIEEIDEVKKIYESENWTAYLKDAEKLIRAFENSSFILGAFEEDTLIGFVRCLGDNEHFVIVQDLIVNKEYRRKGIAKKLLEMCRIEFENVRMLCLMTDKDDKVANAFYQSIGMKTADELEFNTYVMV